MIRGTTPTLEFTLPFDTADITEGYITFVQGGKKILEKALSDTDKDGKVLTLRLSQEDTLSFTPNLDFRVQIRIRTNSGDALASEILKVATEDVLKDGVI